MLSVVSLVIILARAATPAAAPLPGEVVVRAAYAMNGGKWFRTAQWVQRTQQLGSPRPETWYVALQPPGTMRVDVAPGVTGRALVYRNDSLYQFGHGQLRGKAPDVEPLFVLLHDLHSARPEKTIAMLKKFEFNLSRTHERMWEGTRVIVVGALAGDTTSNQFWLEKKRMVLVRMIEQNAADPSRPMDARITGYEKAGNGWLEQSVKVYLGGQLTTVQEYTDVVIDAKLELGLFEPLPYHLPAWVHGAKDIFGRVPNIVLPGH